MPSPLASSAGNANLSVTSSVTGAYNSGVRQYIDVALGKPALEAMADIANAFHLRKADLIDSNDRYAFALRGPDSSLLDLSLSFMQQGILEGDSLILEPA